MNHPQNGTALMERPTQVKKRIGSDLWLVLRKFLTQGTSVASFAPSSRTLATSLVKGINFRKAKVIVELGAGTGPITTELVRRARPGTKLIVIELDPDFCRRLREKFPTVDIVEGDACRLGEILAERGITQADHVISGLPLPSMPVKLRDGILKSAHERLAPDGTFRQITNMPWVFYALYQQYFARVQFRFVPFNFPSGGVYICRDYFGNGKGNGKS